MHLLYVINNATICKKILNNKKTKKKKKKTTKNLRVLFSSFFYTLINIPYFLEAAATIYFFALFCAASNQGRLLFIFLKSLPCSCQNWYATVSIRMFFLSIQMFLFYVKCVFSVFDCKNGEEEVVRTEI